MRKKRRKQGKDFVRESKGKDSVKKQKDTKMNNQKYKKKKKKQEKLYQKYVKGKQKSTERATDAHIWNNLSNGINKMALDYNSLS